MGEVEAELRESTRARALVAAQQVDADEEDLLRLRSRQEFGDLVAVVTERIEHDGAATQLDTGDIILVEGCAPVTAMSPNSGPSEAG